MANINYREALDKLVGFLDDLYFNTNLDHADLIKCISESFNVVMFNFIGSLEEDSKEKGQNKDYFSNPNYLDLSVEMATLINKYRSKDLQIIEIIYVLTNVIKALTSTYNDFISQDNQPESSDSEELFSIKIDDNESSSEEYSETLNNVIEKFKSL